ncbi:ATP-binding protein [Streptomyces niveus]|uniref:ATP-binding protein n=1 Tax=Streptomyces niveus TaxID=193462 RepID=UPI0036F0D7F5
MTIPRGRYYVVELHASPERVSQIRRIVAAHLRHWNLDPHVDPVCSGLGELLTNVHRHVGADNKCMVELRWTGRYLTVAVSDNGPELPRLTSAGGGGLARLASLSDSWGTCGTEEGKVVWFTRSVEAPQNVLRLPAVPVGGTDAAAKEPASALALEPAFVPSLASA